MQRIHLAAVFFAAAILAIANCHASEETKTMQDNTFGTDAAFLKQHTDAIVLQTGQAAIVVVPEYQGRVMTTTARGDNGASSGWINYDLIKQGILPPEKAAGKLDEHMYAFGGEERFWMGPEGGQYSIFFAPGKTFEFSDWFTPDAIDTDAWKVTSRQEDEVVFAHDFELVNHSGTRFDIEAKRTVRLLNDKQASELLGATIPSGIDLVAYQTVNTVTNKGQASWEPESGLLSIWILCMFRPSPTTTVFIPYKQGDESQLGPVVNADYFGAVPPDRLQATDGVIYFKADGNQRGKIGVTPQRSTGLAGSYDPAAQRMTLLIYEPPKKYFGYVNSMWELQEEPFKGDALNSYNDGPVDDSGEQLGPFYEIESSSPALTLKPDESGTHMQTIVHLYGNEEMLQQVLSSAAPVELQKVRSALD